MLIKKYYDVLGIPKFLLLFWGKELCINSVLTEVPSFLFSSVHSFLSIMMVPTNLVLTLVNIAALQDILRWFQMETKCWSSFKDTKYWEVSGSWLGMPPTTGMCRQEKHLLMVCFVYLCARCLWNADKYFLFYEDQVYMLQSHITNILFLRYKYNYERNIYKNGPRDKVRSVRLSGSKYFILIILWRQSNRPWVLGWKKLSF